MSDDDGIQIAQEIDPNGILRRLGYNALIRTEDNMVQYYKRVTEDGKVQRTNTDREKKRHATKTGESKTTPRMKRKIGFGEKEDEEEREMNEGQTKRAKKVKEEEEGEEMIT
ncbi:hypothetical protein ARMSODRAFT_1089741 [Armillaria solidipes]|uniref:Uncharacterized protein n=1 Tax=Armillaria solidipes TaxID=1076256 RepID=A0A2H3ARL3_9AGAR|nr:hypothetical protein ARMSODRAFT_1089741 [Armillaria solidipes]